MAAGISQPNPLPGPVAQIAPVRALAALGDTGSESLRRLMSLEVGKAYAAQVLSRLPGGEFLVGIAGTVAKMALPQGAAIGDALTLRLFGKEPRPLFLLPNDDAPAAAGAALSPAARLIDSLLRQERGDAIIARTPLLPDAAAAHDAAPLGDALRAALEHSGLFYESHVAQWAAGARPMEALLREPQMQAAAALAPAGPASAEAAAPAPAPAAAQSAEAVPDAATLPAMQLDTLDTRRVAWQGELFPGQPLCWEVHAEDEGASARPESVEAPERAWHSALRIDLPGLGAVQARLALRGNRLQLQVDAADADTAAQMRSAGAALSLALEATGIAVDGLTVRHGQP